MPQFDFAHVFWPQLAWLAVFFSVLYFGIVRATLPKLGRVMEARDNQVTGDLATAERAKAAADKFASDYDAGIVAAQESARAHLLAARGSAAASVEATLASANATLDAKAAAASAALDTAKAGALAEIESVAAEAASEIVEKLTGTRPPAVDTAAAARAALG